jgi:hypothetical protein
VSAALEGHRSRYKKDIRPSAAMLLKYFMNTMGRNSFP